MLVGTTCAACLQQQAMRAPRGAGVSGALRGGARASGMHLPRRPDHMQRLLKQGSEFMASWAMGEMAPSAHCKHGTKKRCPWQFWAA